MYVKSSFGRNVELNSIEFSNFGNLFSFKWHSSVTGEENISFGLLRPNSSTLVGFLYFDSRSLCGPSCYVGLEPPQKPTPAERFISNLDDLEDLENSLIYDLWLSTFHLKPVQISKKFFDTFDLDLKLLTMFRDRLVTTIHQNSWFRSSLKLFANRDFDNKPKHDEDNIQEPDNQHSFVSFTIPVNFKFKWPRLMRDTKTINFPCAQVYSIPVVHDLAIFNPSNVSLIVQFMLLDVYPQRGKILELVRTRPDWFSGVPGHDLTNEQPFAIRLSQEVKQNQQKLLKSIDKMNTVPHKNSIIILVPPNQSIDFQVQFKPEKVK